MSSLSCYRSRFLFLLTTLCLIVQMAMIHPTWAGGAGPCPPPFEPDCSDRRQICQSGPSAGLECLDHGDCPNSKCEGATFFPGLPRVCSNDQSQACFGENDCILPDKNPSQGKCLIAFEEQTPLIHATLTLIVDDEETYPHEDEPIRGAATVLLEVENGGYRSLLAQAYVAMDENYPEVEFLRTEMGLNDAVVNTSLLNRLLFRDAIVSNNPHAAESGFQLGQALRELFGVAQLPVRPVIVGTPERIRPIDHTDHGADEIASVVRLRVFIRFVRVDTN